MQKCLSININLYQNKHWIQLIEWVFSILPQLFYVWTKNIQVKCRNCLFPFRFCGLFNETKLTPSLTTKCRLNQPYFDSKYWLNVYTITFSLRMLTCCCFYYSCQCVEHIASNSTDWLRRWNEQLLRNTKVDTKKCCCFYQQTRLKSEFHWMNTPLIATEVFFRYKKKLW